MLPTSNEYRSHVPVTRVRSSISVNSRILAVLARGVYPLAEPPLLLLVRAAGIVVSNQIVKVFALMLRRHPVLADHLHPFLIIRRRLRTRIVSRR